MKYEAVIFDLFGTLIEKFSLAESQNTLRQMASVLSIPAEDFIGLWFDTFDDRGLGGLGILQTVEANVKLICQRLGVSREDTQTSAAAKINIEYTQHAMKPSPYSVELLSYLQLHGYRTVLITNCSAEIPAIWQDTPFAPLFDLAIFSCSVGIQKPDCRIYQRAVEHLAVKSNDCLYVGDGDSNELTGAAAVGMHPVLIRDPNENSADVHRVGTERDIWQGPVISSLSEVLGLLE